MPKRADNLLKHKGLMCAIAASGLFLFSACTTEHKEEVDKLNKQAYAFHYRNIDSTETYAKKALSLSADYADGRAEAYNNLAFADMAHMEYGHAEQLIDSVAKTTDNQVELLVADVYGMRLCQRMSRNKEFYDYNERAVMRLKRIEDERHALTSRLEQRFNYAKSEYGIVRSTYYYYVGLQKQSKEALDNIVPSELEGDTAQYLNYLYQVGSGGIIEGQNDYETCQQEFESLLECFLTAQRGGFIYWEANALQALSEHLNNKEQRLWLTANNPVTLKYINKDDMPDTLVAGYLAQRSLDLFMKYGDTYQIAGAYRTLASCYWAIGDYTSSLICLKNALADKHISQAPDLEASIREQLSITYSALDDKANSDRNRNLYLDMQEKSRQDRQLEARAEQLARTSTQLNLLAGFILALLLIVVLLIIVLRCISKNKNRDDIVAKLLNPLRKWEETNKLHFKELEDKREEIDEAIAVSRLHIENDKKRNEENRAKIFLANSVMPYIDRIINEAERLQDPAEPAERRQERMQYITELTAKINECNTVLTSWIQLRQGQLGIKIESFPLQSVFDIVRRASMSFKLKGLTLEVAPTKAVVKADKTLTLFMLNTLADNSRKFTDKGGVIKISAKEEKDYVEVSVEDNGQGLTTEELATVFNRQITSTEDKTGGREHGFGLLNCRGIIEKYKKTSRVFSVCGLFADSRKGKGSRFFFRLPHGTALAVCLFLMFANLSLSAKSNPADGINKGDVATEKSFLKKAEAFADSAYYSNVNGEYARTLDHVITAIHSMNSCYHVIYPKGQHLMSFRDDGKDTQAEIEWFRANAKIDYRIILDLRNEAAVAALALHQWDVYTYNNKIYTQLFKLRSADSGLAEYCRTMQRSSSNMAIAVAVLALLLIAAVVSYYFFYYRHVLYFRFCVDNVNNLNTILLDSSSLTDKLKAIRNTDTRKYPDALKQIIEAIRTALEKFAAESGRSLTDLELASDELKRAEYEDAKLYVCNNVTDNCLSALKHETMYYPSRISQITAASDCDVHALAEVAKYYRELCAILARQAANIAAGVKFDCQPVTVSLSDGSNIRLMGDKVLTDYLFDIIKRQNKGIAPNINIEKRNGRYVILTAECTNIQLTEAECANLFTPAVKNIPYLICRQIVRDMGEATNLHACGITAEAKQSGVLLRLTLAGA